MKKLAAIILVLFCFTTIIAQDVPVLMQEAEKLEHALNEKAALEKYQQVIKAAPANVYALTKCSELCSRVGNRETSVKARMTYYETAEKFAAIALKIEPASSAANCMMAIALGRVSLEKSGKEKVKAAKEIKKYVDLALKNDPQNYKAWHVLGRWNYEISNLGFLEKAAVNVLFGGMPKASFKEAVQAFEKARSLSAGFVLNYFELAKAYKKNGQKENAIAALNTLLQLPDGTQDDEAAKNNARKLLKEWN
jgi:tetratricopeptide (TPR) repeat protein